METNTFGCNEIVLAEFGLAHRAEELNEISVRLAKEVAADFAGPVDLQPAFPQFAR